MTDDSNDTAVKVGVRIRPMLSSEIQDGATRCVRHNSTQIMIGNDNAFTFDNIFAEETSQSEVYEASVMPLVNAFFEGFNATVLAYGQTASGKTYTMGSSSNLHLPEKDYGIIPRVVDDIFLNIQKIEANDRNSTYRLRIQYLELYGEELKDLLDPLGTVRIAIRETPSGEMYLSGAREEQVTSAKEVFRLLEKGSLSRTTGSTRMNQSSSRSHAIFTILLEHSIHYPSQAVSSLTESGSDFHDDSDECTMPAPDLLRVPSISRDGPEIRKCKFHFVDLAGSERAKRTGAQGVRLKEGIDINKGLLVLGNVISALGGEQQRAHVPYRDSKLTRLLQDSLGGNSKTVMLCCVSPADSNFNESLNAVRYANRARNIQNKPVVNIDPTSLLISQMTSQIQMLASEVLLCRGHEHDLPRESLTFSEEDLRVLASGGMQVGNSAATLESSAKSSRTFPTNNDAMSPTGSSVPLSSRSSDCSTDGDSNTRSTIIPPSTKLQIINLEKEIVALKEKNRANCSSLDFYTDKCDRLQRHSSQQNEELIQVQSERDFYKIHFSVAKSQDSAGAPTLVTAPSTEDVGGSVATLHPHKSQIEVLGGYIREINRLKGIIASLQQRQSEEGGGAVEGLLETEFTSNIAKLFTSTEKQLRCDTQILQEIERSGNDENEGESDEDSGAKVDEEENFEVQGKLYQHRTKLMSTEVLDISESIHLKEELVHQLHQSQKQYEAMKQFYETKLESLCEEMEAKELEKQKVVDDLRDVSLSLRHEHDEDEHIRKEREVRLNKLLHKKELELKALKKRQVELTNLSKVQSRSFDQIKRLETDILQLKKQRVSLSKSLQQEKKIFLGSLNSKAKEIEKLKKELSIAMSKMTKLGQEKEQSKLKINKMLQEEIFRRKKTAEARRRNFNKATKESSAAPPTPRSTRRMLQSLVETSHKNGSLTLNEQKTRSWIEASTRLLIEQEEAVADLSVQCEQQLVLLHTKKDLEETKQSLVSESSSPEAMSDVDSAISKVANQLKCRNTEISRKKAEIDSNSSSLSKEEILQNLYQSSGSSPNEIQVILKVLFEVILSSHKQTRIKSNKLQDAQEKQHSLQVSLDDTLDKLNSQASNYHREISRIEKEYQAKMAGLFNHSGFRELIKPSTSRDNLGNNPLSSNDSSDDKYSVEDDDGMVMQGDSCRRSPHDKFSSDGLKAVVAVAEERNATLQSQLSREELRVHELEAFVDECNIETRLIHEKYDAKCRENSFLEEECRMLRDILGDLKAELSSSDNRSAAVSSDVIPHSLLPTHGSDSRVDFDDESESVLGQYSVLREEIISTGSVMATDNGAHHNSIFDRLTNPSYFTGTQKIIFKKDVREVNRAKVQRRKGESHKKERKRKDEIRTPPQSVHYRDCDLHHDHQEDDLATAHVGGGEQQRPWSVSSCESLEERMQTPPRASSPAGAQKHSSSPCPPSGKSPPGSLNENVFSRLLNPNKFTGIHRRHMDSPA